MHDPASQQVMTLDEFYRLPDDELRYELVNGWLVSEPPPGARHGRVLARLTSLLDAYARERRAGVVVSGDSGFVLHSSPYTVRAPDIAFIRLARYQALEDERLAVPGAPDLAIEILSPANRRGEIHAKVADYLEAGGTLVWVVDPELEQVFTYRSLFEPQCHSGSQSLIADDLLPGLSLTVADIFSIQAGRETGADPSGLETL